MAWNNQDTATVAATAAQLANAALQGSGKKKSDERMMKYNKEQSELAYQRSLDAYHMQNEYNSPEQQMLRLSRAGLNPNLVYGNGSAANIGPTSSPSFTPPEGRFQNRAPDLSALPQLALGLELTRANIDNVRANTRNVEASTEMKGRDLNREEMLRPYTAEWHELDIQKKRREKSFDAQQLTNMSEQEKIMKLTQLEKEQNISNNDAKMAAIELHNQYQRYENILAKNGIMRGDSVGMRMVIQLLAASGIDVMKSLSEGTIGNALRKLFGE